MKSRIKVLYLFFPNEKHTGVDSEQCGVCGKESDIVDVNGNKLCVGDVVEYADHITKSHGIQLELNSSCTQAIDVSTAIPNTSKSPRCVTIRCFSCIFSMLLN